MTLPTPPDRYDKAVEAERNRSIEDSDRKNLKRQQDIDMVSGARLILKSPNGGRWNITVGNTGTITAVAI